MNTNNYLPFDLETALKHPERVVTRDGRKVEQLIDFKGITDSQLLACVLDSEVEFFYRSGFYCDRRTSKNDLFLLPEVKECWVNVYDDGSSLLRLGDGKYSSKEEAVFNATDSLGTYIKTIRITNQPE